MVFSELSVLALDMNCLLFLYLNRGLELCNSSVSCFLFAYKVLPLFVLALDINCLLFLYLNHVVFVFPSFFLSESFCLRLCARFRHELLPFLVYESWV